ncbi:MAG TPA: efflux RND transporter periplasmic adaptor subunit [Bryobacteraceae bacterium]|nr:efflux RND transporter periplasmic adaptor subunit [Bryobacteraceae bacterium]
MSRLRLLLLLFLIVLAAVVVWAYRRSAQPSEVPFARAIRERLVSTLVTNGKGEPYQWSAVRAAGPGLVETVAVARGQSVAAGALIATLDNSAVRGDVAAAEAALAQARAQLTTIEQGGSAAARVEIENALARAQLDLANAQRELDTLQRLEKRNAATSQQVTQAVARVEQSQAEIAALERKRGALVDKPDRAAAEARLSEAQAQLEQARARLAGTRITSPVAGIVYELDARPGAYLNAGDMVASIGKLDRLRVRVYVDEPEMGRVQQGMPVTITWDAMPGREWKGVVETTPTQVISLGTRQVGEVICTIENPGAELPPGANVNAEIQTQVVENAITIPKEAVRRNAANEVGVFLLRGESVEWRSVRLGASSVTRTAVEGLAEGDAVALATERPLENGQRVQPVMR